MMRILIKLGVGALLALSWSVQADMMSDVASVQKAWAHVQYEVSGKAQKTEYLPVVEQATKLKESHPKSAEAYIWSGIVQSSYAGVKGGLGAMKFAKAAKADFEKAMALDDKALSGSAYTSMGILYAKVPGWPIGFGNKDKAKAMLEKALELNPNGIDSNYFYADYLVDQKQHAEAKEYALKAQQAPARPDRPVADKGRQAEISVLLAKIKKWTGM